MSISEVCDVNPRLVPETLRGDELVAFVGMAELDDVEAVATDREQRPYAEVAKGYTPFVDGDVLVAKITPCFQNNKIGIARTSTRYAFGSTEFHVLRPRTDTLDHRYLLHFLRRADVLRLGEMRMTGAGGQRRVPLRFFDELRMPLPPIEEQRRIAKVLDAADGLRAKRREALAQLDTLTRAIYIDLFDHPIANRLGWETSPLSSLGRIHTGKTPPGKKRGMYGDAVPFITPGDLESTEVAQRWLSNEGAAHSRVVPPGSTLVCCIGATIGKVGCASEVSAFNQQINAIDWDQEAVEPTFGTQTMRFLSSEVARRGASTTLPLLKKSAFERLTIPVPPLRHQVRFTKAVEALDGQRRTGTRQAGKLDELFASLQQRAFRGEL